MHPHDAKSPASPTSHHAVRPGQDGTIPQANAFASHDAKTAAIYQPYFFPYLGYWQLLDAADAFIVADRFQHIMRGFINRNSILLDHAPHRFTISLREASPNKIISDIEIGDDFRGFRAMLRHAYAKAPHFHETMDVIDQVLSCQDRNLAGFLTHQIEIMAGYLGLRARISRMSDLPPDVAGSSREQRLCSYARSTGAGRIINPIGSRSLYSREDFLAHDVDMAFLRTHDVVYPQRCRTFFPGLSIIDAMMHNPRDSLMSMVKRYDVVDANGAPLWNSR